MVEARAVLGPEAERHQEDRIRQLMDNLSGRLNRTVLIHPILDLPSNLPTRRIPAMIEERSAEVEVLQEFVVEGEHEGEHFSLEVTTILEDKPSPTLDVGATIGQPVDVHVGQAVRKGIAEKAGKYGEIPFPFVIAVWPKLPFHFSSEDDDLVALYGDKVLDVSSFGGVSGRVVPNGVFNLKREDGNFRYALVSAVLVCRPDSLYDKLRVCHNPFVKNPMTIDLFKGSPQCIIDLATGKENWLR